MPTLRVNGAELYHEDTGGPGEPVVFAHGLLWSGWLFHPQVADLRDRCRCVTFDFRGQGRSELTPDGYDMDTLAADAAALIEALGLGPCHLVGLSMGGFVAMRLAARRPELVRSLALLSTSADREPLWNRLSLLALRLTARGLSLRLAMWRAKAVMFGPRFLSDPARTEFREACYRQLLTNRPAGVYRAARGVAAREPVHEIERIKAPTLVLVGEDDAVTKPEASRRIAARVPGATLVSLPGVGHTPTLEAPAQVSEALRELLGGTAAQ
jgi:pimeloyl-ACP methyl ester carboxylesterase